MTHEQQLKEWCEQGKGYYEASQYDKAAQLFALSAEQGYAPALFQGFAAEFKEKTL